MAQEFSVVMALVLVIAVVSGVTTVVVPLFIAVSAMFVGMFAAGASVLVSMYYLKSIVAVFVTLGIIVTTTLAYVIKNYDASNEALDRILGRPRETR